MEFLLMEYLSRNLGLIGHDEARSILIAKVHTVVLSKIVQDRNHALSLPLKLGFRD
jgi:hypothetical protein